MTARAHFRTSSEPLKERMDYEVLCGETVHDAIFLFEIDLHDGQHPVPTFAFCGHCFKVLASDMMQNHARRYVYAMVPDQDLRDWGVV